MHFEINVFLHQHDRMAITALTVLNPGDFNQLLLSKGDYFESAREATNRLAYIVNLLHSRVVWH